MSRFHARNIYIVQFLHTQASRENPLSASRISELLESRNIHCDVPTVISDIDLMQRAGVGITSSAQDPMSFYMER